MDPIFFRPTVYQPGVDEPFARTLAYRPEEAAVIPWSFGGPPDTGAQPGITTNLATMTKWAAVGAIAVLGIVVVGTVGDLMGA